MISEYYLEDIDETYAPPEKPILRLALVGFACHITIGKYEETNSSTTFTKIAEGCFPLQDVMNALTHMKTSGDWMHNYKGLPPSTTTDIP